MKNEVTEAGLKQVVNSMLDGFMRRAEQEHLETVVKIVEEHGDALMNPEHYRLYVSHKSEMMERVLVKSVLSKLQLDRGIQLSIDQFHKLSNVYTDYQFFESQVRRLIEEYEGHACCADKSRYLMKAYVDYIITGELPDFADRSPYWVPSLGSPESWMGVLARCTHLQYGQFDFFKEARDVLIAELEQHVETRLESLDQFFTSHEHFVRKEEEEKGKVVYHFIEEKGTAYFHGQIVVHSKNGGGYIANTRRDGAKEGRLGYGDAKPDWFESLLKRV